MIRVAKKIILLLLTGFVLSGCNQRHTEIADILSPSKLPDLKMTKIMRASSHDSLGNTTINIPAGSRIHLFESAGPGIITRIWFDAGNADASVLRQVLIRMYWDKEKLPSVEVPFSDFFGCGFGYVEYTSQFLSMAGGGFLCLFPMPFEDDARIEILNESGTDIKKFTYQIDYHKIDTYLSRDIGYFHATWRRDIRTDYDSAFLMLKARGRGHIVGASLNIQSYNGRLDFLSGKEIIYVDGEKKPSIVGTGTAEYFMGSNGFSSGLFTTPLSGLIVKDDSLGRISAYRFHVPDAITFKKSVVFSIEHGKDNQDIADYSATVFWYQVEPHTPFAEIEKAVLRIPLRAVTSNHLYEAENLTIKMGSIKSHLEDMKEFGPEWSESKQLVIESSKGSDFSVRFSQMEDISYDAEIYFTRAPDFGNADVYIDNEKAGEIRGYSPNVIPGGKITLKNIHNPSYTFDIRFVITGKDSASSGYSIGLDGINLIPGRVFISEWKISGPWFIKSRTKKHFNLIDYSFPPEGGAGKGAGKETRSMKLPEWQYVKPGSDGYVSLDKFIRPNEPDVLYAKTGIYSPESKIMYLYIGSDDAMKVYLNGKEVYKYTGKRFAEPDQGKVFLRITKGWNTILIKIVNRSGSSGFYARILDRGNILKYSAEIKDNGK